MLSILFLFFLSSSCFAWDSDNDLCPNFPPMVQPLRQPRRVMTWIFTKNDSFAGLQSKIGYMKENKASFSCASPTTFGLEERDDGTVDLGWVTLQEPTILTQGDFLDALYHEGFDLVPLIFEDRTEDGDLLPVLRKLFANPTRFFESALRFAKAYHLKGFNIDFETEEIPTEEDFFALKMFLDAFSALMHSVGLTVTMDINAQFPLFNHTVLSNSAVDKFIIMDTYAPGFPFFLSGLNHGLGYYPPSRLGIGFFWCGYNTTELSVRMGMASLLGIDEIDIWAAPVSSDWLHYFAKFLRGEI